MQIGSQMKFPATKIITMCFFDSNEEINNRTYGVINDYAKQKRDEITGLFNSSFKLFLACSKPPASFFRLICPLAKPESSQLYLR